jgi:hypothetical protein
VLRNDSAYWIATLPSVVRNDSVMTIQMHLLHIHLLPVNAFSMANSVQHNITAYDVVANPIITDANPPPANLNGFQFSPTEGIFSELFNCAFSSTSEG